MRTATIGHDDGHAQREPANSPDSAWLTASMGGTLPLLSRSQEVALARRIREASRPAPQRRRRSAAVMDAEVGEARERFIRANLRLVWHVARKYRWIEGVDIADLVQEGYTGLIEAVERFDPDNGARFSTYATWWILKAIRRSIDTRSRLIRVPVHVLNRQRELRKLTRRLRAERAGREPSLDDLAAALGTEPTEIQFLLDIGRLPQSLDESGDAEGDDRRAGHLTDTRTPTPDEFTERRLLHANLRRALGDLPRFERGILERRFGLASREPETLQAIGRSLGLTRERVRRIELLLLEALRESKPLRGVYAERRQTKTG